MNSLRTDKLEAARRQIDSAIRMLFGEEDLVAVMTVAGAACRVVRDLSERRGTGESWLALNSIFKPGMAKPLWNEVANRAPNFLKHADKDPGAVLEDVSDVAVDYTIWLAAVLYFDLTGTQTVAMKCFRTWMWWCNPKDYPAETPAEKVLFQLFTDQFAELSREKHLRFGKSMLAWPWSDVSK